MKKKAAKINGPKLWAKYRKGRSFYFVYNHNSPHVQKLLEKHADYGVVQLCCIINTAKDAYLAGYRAGKRLAVNG